MPMVKLDRMLFIGKSSRFTQRESELLSLATCSYSIKCVIKSTHQLTTISIQSNDSIPALTLIYCISAHWESVHAIITLLTGRVSMSFPWQKLNSFFLIYRLPSGVFKDTFYFLVIEHWALLGLHDVQGVEFVVSAVRQRQRAPRRQLLLSRVNIRL